MLVLFYVYDNVKELLIYPKAAKRLSGSIERDSELEWCSAYCLMADSLWQKAALDHCNICNSQVFARMCLASECIIY